MNPRAISLPMDDRFNRLRYSLYAPVYDALTGMFGSYRRAAIETMGVRPAQRVLLVGCGTGLDLDFIPRGASVTGLDVTPGMIVRTERRAVRLGLGGDYVVGDARALPFADGSFDVVILHLILAVAPEPERIAREANRVLVPGGRVSIFDKFLPAGQSPGIGRRVANVATRLLFSEINRTVEPMIAAAGWRILSDQPAGFRGAYRRIVASKPLLP